jgi:hypothetical protein
MSRRVVPEGEAPCTHGASPNSGRGAVTWRDAPEDAPLRTSARWGSVAPEGEAPCTHGAFPDSGRGAVTWRDAPEDAPLRTSARWGSVAPEGEAPCTPGAFPNSVRGSVTWRDAPEDAPLRTSARWGSSRSIASVESGFTDYTAGKNVASSSNFTPAIVSAVLFASIPLGAGQSIGFWDNGYGYLTDSKFSAQAPIHGTIQSIRADGTPSSDNNHTALGPFVSWRLLLLFITCSRLE